MLIPFHAPLWLQIIWMSEAKRLHDRLVCKFGLSLKVPLSTYVHQEGPDCVSLPYLKPTHLLHVLLTKHPWILFGGFDGPHPEALLKSFWSCYQKEHPEHEVFKNPERLGSTFPITVHGDGGRTQKKQPLEIFAFQPVLGLNTASQRSMSCKCPTSASFGGSDLQNPAAQCLNSKHSTYLTHFLLFAFPSKKYSSFDNLLTSFLKEVMDDLARACEEGITLDSGTVYYAACIGFKLDMEWMVKVGSLTRSYQNVGHVTSHPCCHECDAGQAMVPFEDVNPSAAWMNTRFNTIPWTDQPPWDKIPFDDSKPAKFLRRDAFHIFRLGICRNFLGSSIYLLIYMGCFLILLGLHVLCFL